jgi:hypothetical protein
MQKMKLEVLLLIGMILLSAGSALSGPVPPTPGTPVGGGLWTYVTTGVVLGVGAWKIWKK